MGRREDSRSGHTGGDDVRVRKHRCASEVRLGRADFPPGSVCSSAARSRPVWLSFLRSPARDHALAPYVTKYQPQLDAAQPVRDAGALPHLRPPNCRSVLVHCALSHCPRGGCGVSPHSKRQDAASTLRGHPVAYRMISRLGLLRQGHFSDCRLFLRKSSAERKATLLVASEVSRCRLARLGRTAHSFFARVVWGTRRTQPRCDSNLQAARRQRFPQNGTFQNPHCEWLVTPHVY
jgi:hypothetical protein